MVVERSNLYRIGRCPGHSGLVEDRTVSLAFVGIALVSHLAVGAGEFENVDR